MTEREAWGYFYVRTKLLTIMALAMIISMFGPAAVAESSAALPMCDPVTLDTLFPADDHPDGPIGDEKPVDEQEIDDGSLVDPLQAPAPEPAQVEGERSAPGTQTRPTPSETPTPKPKTENCRPFVYDMLSPVAGQPGVISTFGVPRPDNRKHKGADIAAPKMTPVYAVSDGTVFWLLDQQAGDCCAVAIRHLDGWMSYYIHLNNDTFGTDDGLGYGIAPGLTKGTEVAAGQLLGWIGDSGNAEDTVSHVHFELRTPGNEAVDAIPSLSAAAVPSLFSAAVSNGTRSYTEPFDDDDGTAFEPLLGRLASLGLLTGCGDPVGVSFCPDAAVTGNDAVAMIESFMGIRIDPISLLEYRDQAAGGPEAGDRCGVDLYCPDTELTNDQLGVLVSDALDMLAQPSKSTPTDLASLLSPATLAVEAGSFDDVLPVSIPSLPPLVVARCEDLPDHESQLGTISTRGELVVYLAQETGLIETVPCGQLR